MAIVQQLSLVDDGKTCNKCGKWRLYSEFIKNAMYRGGFTAQCRACKNARSAERQSEKRAEDPERYKREYAEWYAKNGDEYHRAYRAKNRERYRELKRKRYDADPEKHLAESKHRSAMRRGSTSGSHTNEEWKALCARYDNRCLLCFSKKRLTRDHMVPLTQGGTDSIDNIGVLCMPCNARKNNRHLNCRPDRLLPAYSPPP